MTEQDTHDQLPAWEPSEPIEDYESLHHTFLHGHGNRHAVAQVEHVRYEPPPPPIAWERLAIYIPLGLAVTGLAVLAELGLMPPLVLAAMAVPSALLGWWLAGRHSIRRLQPQHMKDYKRGHWSTPAAARAHTAATLYQQRRQAWRRQGVQR